MKAPNLTTAAVLGKALTSRNTSPYSEDVNACPPGWMTGACWQSPSNASTTAQ
jgi:hypothetical protein